VEPGSVSPTAATGEGIGVGLLNLRDVGACVTRDGRVVTPGLVLRSAEPVDLTPQEVRLIRDHLGVRTTIDLRGPDEHSLRRCAEIEACGIAVHHVPMVAASSTEPLPRIRSFKDVGDFYAATAVRRSPQLARVMTILANEELPALVHCAAGKDRTGIAIALLLDLLGVPDDLIIADYAATEGAMAAILRRIGTRAAGIQQETIPAALLRAPVEAMERFLDRLRADHGTAEHLLIGAGLDEQTPAVLRDRLLR
jgi:protein-tyrosine phosphatase